MQTNNRALTAERGALLDLINQFINRANSLTYYAQTDAEKKAAKKVLALYEHYKVIVYSNRNNNHFAITIIDKSTGNEGQFIRAIDAHTCICAINGREVVYNDASNDIEFKEFPNIWRNLHKSQ